LIIRKKIIFTRVFSDWHIQHFLIAKLLGGSF